ncbi:MAG: hypothetical protein ACK4SN_14030 [Bellilinea sp.]
MPRRPGNPGTCSYCGEIITKRGVNRHLEKCAKRQEVLRAAEASQRPVEKIWHLRVYDAYDKDYWLDLEMTGSARLAKLDHYLRSIWLECCDHLSMFTIGGWGGLEIGQSRKADAVFKTGLILRHIYDFGSSSYTDIKVVGFREGKPTTRHPIALLARNLKPAPACQECGQSADWLCVECQIEEGKTGYLCDRHLKGHPHEDYGDPIRLVNSPRVGLCAYDGPAEPPY